MQINVEKSMVEKIEALQYEVESRKDVISQILASGFKISGDTFEKYQTDYRNFFIQFNKAKQEMLKVYNVPGTAKWNLDFASGILTIEE